MKESNTKSIYDIKRKEKYVVRNSRTNEIGKVIFPHPVLFGVGSDQVAGGLSGSLQQTVDGLSYLVAGENTTITTGSNGQITISSAIPGGSSAAGGGGGGGIVAIPPSFYKISVANQSDILADSTTDTLTLVGGTNVSIETNADTDTITISSSNTGTTYTAGPGLDLSGTEFAIDVKPSSGIVIDSAELSIDNSIIATISGATFTGAISAPAISGSLTQLHDGTSYLRQGSNITIVTGSDGSITISGDITAVSARNKQAYILTSPHPANTDFSVLQSDFSDVEYNSNLIDIHLNGQLLLSGSPLEVSESEADYSIVGESSLRFSSGLSSNDNLSVIISKLKDPNAIDFAQMKFITFGSEASLVNERVLVASEGVSISLDNPQEISISANRTKKFFDITEPLPIAQPYNCSPIDFTSVNFNPDRIDVFLNGQILRSGSGHDYLLQETSSILFNTALDQGDDILVILF